MAKQLSRAWRRALLTDTRTEVPGQAVTESAVACLTVLFHPDLRRVGQRATLPALGSRRLVKLSRAEPVFGHRSTDGAGPLADPFLSRRPWLLRRRHDEVCFDRSGSSSSLRVDGVEIAEAVKVDAERLEAGVLLELAGRVVLLLHLADPVPAESGEHEGWIGESAGMVRLRRDLERVAKLDVPVLLRGETGSGKELAARALHRTSLRSQAPFVAVNMAAIPNSLAAAELFGTRRGAFSGADRSTPGYFRRAHGGTLFLDEIGETPIEVQPLLLRALESGEVQTVGGGTETVDVRVVAATDVDLERAISRDAFRGPLYHRLSGYELWIPPLRQRLDDFGRLLRHFLFEELRGLGCEHLCQLAAPDDEPWLAATTVAALASYPWPGNVRELRAAVREIVVDGHDRPQARLTSRLKQLLARPAGTPAGPSSGDGDCVPEEEPSAAADRPWAGRPQQIPEDVLVETLRQHRWTLKPAAEALGISRPSLYKRVAASPRIRRAADLGREEVVAALAEAGADLDALVDRLEVSKDALRRRLGDLGLP